MWVVVVVECCVGGLFWVCVGLIVLLRVFGCNGEFLLWEICGFVGGGVMWWFLVVVFLIVVIMVCLILC